MIAKVITIKGFAPSEASARRCIHSAGEFGIEVTHHQACTPRDDPERLFGHAGWETKGFDHNPYSKRTNAMACFMSHLSLWRMAVELDESVLIFEHDAVVKRPFPEEVPDFSGVCNFGEPSFGAWSTPRWGFALLTSKRFFPGAHCYLVSPEFAPALIQKAEREACPTDVFLHRSRFPFLSEFFRWPVECVDSFSTVQLERGCQAKRRHVKPVDLP